MFARKVAKGDRGCAEADASEKKRKQKRARRNGGRQSVQLQIAGRSDGEALAALQGEGFMHEIAESWGANNCLLDSLL